MALPTIDPTFTAFIVGVVGSLFAGIASLISAIKSTKNGKKVDVIHELTNGNNEKLKTELEHEKRKNEYLTRMVIELADFNTPGTLQTVREKLDRVDSELGNRRQSDSVVQIVKENML